MKNRISFESIQEHDRSRIRKLFAKNKNSLLMLVFTAPWAGSALILETFLEDLVEQYPAVEVSFVDTEEYAQLATNMRVSELPTTLFVKDGQILDHFTGVIPKKKIRHKLEALKKL